MPCQMHRKAAEKHLHSPGIILKDLEHEMGFIRFNCAPTYEPARTNWSVLNSVRISTYTK